MLTNIYCLNQVSSYQDVPAGYMCMVFEVVYLWQPPYFLKLWRMRGYIVLERVILYSEN